MARETSKGRGSKLALRLFRTVAVAQAFLAMVDDAYQEAEIDLKLSGRSATELAISGSLVVSAASVNCFANEIAFDMALRSSFESMTFSPFRYFYFTG